MCCESEEAIIYRHQQAQLKKVGSVCKKLEIFLLWAFAIFGIFCFAFLMADPEALKLILEHITCHYFE